MYPLPPNPIISPPPSNRASNYCSSGVVIPPFYPFNTQPARVPTTPAHIFFLRKKIPASHRARGEVPTVSLALGANREGKERVNGKASPVQSTRKGSALVCVRRNVQHCEVKLSKSSRSALITAAMVAAPTSGPTGCLVSPSPLFSQNIQSHEKSPTSHRAQGVLPTVSLALGANREGKEIDKGKANRIQSSQIGSALVCVRRNAQHRELKLPESTRCVLNTVLMVAVSICGPTGATPPNLSSQNVQSHEKSLTSPRARDEAPTMSFFVLGTDPEGKENVKGKANRIQSIRIGSALVCVRRNTQHLKLKLLESTRFVLNTVC